MKNKTNMNVPLGALSGKTGPSRTLDLAALLSRSLSTAGPIEAWVHVAIIDAVEQSGITHLRLATPGHESSDLAVSATISESTRRALAGAVGAIYPLFELAGHELDLRLKAERTGSQFGIAVIDIDRPVLEAAVRRRFRESRHALIDASLLHRQADLLQPDGIRAIEVFYQEGDLAWPGWQARLDLLARAGFRYKATPIPLSGIAGFMTLTIALEDLNRRAAVDEIDVVLIVASEVGSCPALLELDTAVPACTMPAYVVVGMPRAPLGSLLHDVAFAGCDSPAAALAILEDLARDTYEALAREGRRESISWSASSWPMVTPPPSLSVPPGRG